MSKEKNKPLSKILYLRFLVFLRRYPAVLFLLKWLLIGTCAGTGIGSASALFLQTLDLVTAYRESRPELIMLLPLGGFLIGLLYDRYGAGTEAGNNLLIANIQAPRTIIPFRMAPFVYLGTLVTHLLGGSAGREGTALQMAGAIADQFTGLFRLDRNERRLLLIAAVAAGFGSVFGTPVAGAVFGLEVSRIGRIRYEALFPAFFTSLLADYVTRWWDTAHTHYAIPLVPPLTLPYLLYAIGAGILFGLCAAAFSKLMQVTGGVFRRRIPSAPLRPVVGGVLVVAGVALAGTTRYVGLGIPVISAAFLETLPPSDFLLKMLFTVITLASGFKGGEVTPLFFIGATLGSAFSAVLPLPPALLAGMGFAAVFAGATNTPLASTLMAMELFGADCSPYVAIACVVSYLFSGHTGIYGQQLLGSAKHRRFIQDEGRRLADL